MTETPRLIHLLFAVLMVFLTESSEISSWIQGLESDSFQVREESSRKLLQQGQEAINPLRELAETDRGEAAIRAVQLLVILSENKDQRTSEEAAEALESLVESDNPIILPRVQERLTVDQNRRNARALNALVKLGAKVHYYAPELAPRGDNLPDEPIEQVARLSYIVIGSDWKGGEEGFRLLHRIDSLPTLYVTRSVKVSEDVLLDVQEHSPFLVIQRRGDAWLGISADTTIESCIISEVKKGSAADLAGIRIGDMIVGIGGKEVTTFASLIDLISEKTADEEVEVEFLRGGEQEKVLVKLQAWK